MERGFEAYGIRWLTLERTKEKYWITALSSVRKIPQTWERLLSNCRGGRKIAPENITSFQALCHSIVVELRSVPQVFPENPRKAGSTYAPTRKREPVAKRTWEWNSQGPARGRSIRFLSQRHHIANKVPISLFSHPETGLRYDGPCQGTKKLYLTLRAPHSLQRRVPSHSTWTG